MPTKVTTTKSAKASKPKIWDGRGDRLEGMRYSILPADVADDLDLGMLHLRFLAHLGRQNAKRGWCRISQAELAEKWGCSRCRLNQAIKALVRRGHVRELVSQQTRECWCTYQIVIRSDDDEVFRGGNTPPVGPEGSVTRREQECSASGAGVSPQGNRRHTDLADLADQEESRPFARPFPSEKDLPKAEEPAPDGGAMPNRDDKSNGDPVYRAVEAYNRTAEQYKLSPCNTVSKVRRRKLTARIEDIGGIENFERALRAIPQDDWMMGRIRKAGKEDRPFKLDIDYLLQTEGKSGDVLAKLHDRGVELERTRGERFTNEYFNAFIRHMLDGHEWSPPEWREQFPAPWPDGKPMTTKQARDALRAHVLWTGLVKRYETGDVGAEQEFKRIRCEMFDAGERERLFAARDKALEDQKRAGEELRRTAALQREAARAKREAREREEQQNEPERKAKEERRAAREAAFQERCRQARANVPTNA